MNIKKLRKRLKLTQTEFAKLIGVSFCSVNRWENFRHRPHPMVDRACKVIIDGLRKKK